MHCLTHLRPPFRRKCARWCISTFPAMHFQSIRRPECNRLPVRRTAAAGRVLVGCGCSADLQLARPGPHWTPRGGSERGTNSGSLGASIELVVSARELNDPEARETGRRALAVVQGHQPGSPPIERSGDVQQIDGTHSGVSGRGCGQALGLRKD